MRDETREYQERQLQSLFSCEEVALQVLVTVCLSVYNCQATETGTGTLTGTWTGTWDLGPRT